MSWSSSDLAKFSDTLGLNLPDDFGTAGISPSSTTSTPVEGNQQARRSRNFDLGLYVFARAEGRAVARNIFLDGNTFGHSQSVDHKWLVADLSVGPRSTITTPKSPTH